MSFLLTRQPFTVVLCVHALAYVITKMAAFRLEDMYIKQQKVPGEGLYCPNDNSEVNVCLKGTYCISGSTQEESRVFLHDSNLCIRIGYIRDYIELILHRCLLCMKSKEVCQVSLCREHISTVLGGTTHHNVAENATAVVFFLELKSFSRAKDIWELTSEERLSLAARHRELGTELYTAGSHDIAGYHYSKAVKYLVGVEHSEETSRLKAVCHLNLAACQLKLEQYNHVVTNCSKALSIDSNNVKGLYRKSLALFYLGDLEESKRLIRRAKDIAPKNTSVSELLMKINTKIKEQDTKMAEALKQMFL